MFIQTEQTPNPLTLKFLPGRVVMKEGTVFFQTESECSSSPLAKELFSIDGVNGVFFGSDFITISKTENHDWQTLKPLIFGKIIDHYNSNQELLIKIEDDLKNNKSNFKEPKQKANKAEKQIKDLYQSVYEKILQLPSNTTIYPGHHYGYSKTITIYKRTASRTNTYT